MKEGKAYSQLLTYSISQMIHPIIQTHGLKKVVIE